MTVGIDLHRKQASSIVKSMLDPRNSVIYVPIYKMSSGAKRDVERFVQVCLYQCSHLRAKPAQLVGHLPARSHVNAPRTLDAHP